MAQLIRLSDHRRHRRRIFFTRSELNTLLGVYSRKVASGEWRDYAIDHLPGMAMFSVFRSSLERPLFAVAKCDAGVQRGPAGAPPPSHYVLFKGRQKLKQSKDLQKILEMLDRRLELVTG